MTNAFDTIIIGGGHNGLTAAAYLAQGGQKVLVLERRAALGGAAATEEVVPGFKFDTCAHSGALNPQIVRDLGLERHGLRPLRRDPSLIAPLPGGGYLSLRRDAGKTAESIRRISPADADKWAAFSTRMGRLAGFVEAVHLTTIPKISSRNPADLLTLLGLGARLKRLGHKDMVEMLRALPMSVFELLNDWFESEALKGALGASGITGTMEGPRASGTAYVMLHHLAGANGAFGLAGQSAQGGIGALSAALATAASAHGAEIRTGAEVERVIVKDDRAAGVVLRGGAEIAARRVASNADPSRTFLGLVGQEHLDPEFVRAVRNIRFRGACAKLNLALDKLPSFHGLNGDAGALLRGALSISPSLDYLEHAYDDAKYGDFSRRPYLEVVIPTLADPSLAPSGKHVMSILMQYAPYRLKHGHWNEQRERLGDAVLDTLAEYSPDLKGAILGRQVLTPLDLEESYGLTEGSMYHGELLLDQLFFMRPVAGWAQYRTPIEGLYLCGAGAHPGGGISGVPGRNAAKEIIKDSRRNA
jgi:phytoene dehydrogenase-like protein